MAAPADGGSRQPFLPDADHLAAATELAAVADVEHQILLVSDRGAAVRVAFAYADPGRLMTPSARGPTFRRLRHLKWSLYRP
ncbi:hypothetical protein [Arthrobacter sp. Z4-13]